MISCILEQYWIYHSLVGNIHWILLVSVNSVSIHVIFSSFLQEQNLIKMVLF